MSCVEVCGFSSESNLDLTHYHVTVNEVQCHILEVRCKFVLDSDDLEIFDGLKFFEDFLHEFWVLGFQIQSSSNHIRHCVHTILFQSLVFGVKFLNLLRNSSQVLLQVSCDNDSFTVKLGVEK